MVLHHTVDCSVLCVESILLLSWQICWLRFQSSWLASEKTNAVIGDTMFRGNTRRTSRVGSLDHWHAICDSFILPIFPSPLHGWRDSAIHAWGWTTWCCWEAWQWRKIIQVLYYALERARHWLFFVWFQWRLATYGFKFLRISAKWSKKTI